MNKVILTGRLAADPIDLTPEGSENKFVVFTVATDASYYDKEKEERINQADYHKCIASRGFASYVLHGEKGQAIEVEGLLKHRRKEHEKGIVYYESQIKTVGVKLGAKAAEKPDHTQGLITGDDGIARVDPNLLTGDPFAGDFEEDMPF